MLLQAAAETKIPATPWIIWQIVLISLIMVIISQLFQWKFSISPQQQLEFQEKIKTLQEEIRIAQEHGDVSRMNELNMELLEMSKDLMKNQFIPLCVRTIVFLVILSILSNIYGKYDYREILGGLDWFWLYVLVSFGMNLIITRIVKAYKKKKGTLTSEQPVVDKIRALQRNIILNQNPQRSILGIDVSQIQNTPASGENVSRESSMKEWKKRALSED